MRKLVIGLALTLGASVAQGAEVKNQAFKCMDPADFSINSQCMADTIGNNAKFKQAQEQVINIASESSDYAMATMTFDQDIMQINIVAHRDALQAMNTLTESK